MAIWMQIRFLLRSICWLEPLDEAEQLSHEFKHPFKDRWGTWHYKEPPFVEQVIRNYCAAVGLQLDD